MSGINELIIYSIYLSHPSFLTFILFLSYMNVKFLFCESGWFSIQ